jgi:hypothetical protein
MSQDPQCGEQSQPLGPAPRCAFTPAEYASLALLRRTVEAGAYDDDRAPPGTALEGQVGCAVHPAGRLSGSAGHPRRTQQVDGDIVIACLNGAGIVAAIVAAALGAVPSS